MSTASARYYQRFVNALAKWPTDPMKVGDRDLRAHLHSQINVWMDEKKGFDALVCEQRLKSLNELITNKHRNDYPHNCEIGVYGIDAEMIREATSDAFRREYLGLRSESSRSKFSDLREYLSKMFMRTSKSN